MRSTYDKMMDRPEFRSFIDRFGHSANFAAATNSNNKWAVLLYIAYGYEAALSIQSSLSEGESTKANRMHRAGEVSTERLILELFIRGKELLERKDLLKALESVDQFIQKHEGLDQS